MHSDTSDETPAPRIALVMPTLNEVDGMHHVWNDIDKSLFHEILVVDGGSTDGTIEFCKENGIKLLMQKGVGMPNALDEAFEATESEYFVTFSPDGNSLAEKLPDLCKKMLEGYDMVIVSRYLDEAYSDDDDAITGPGNWVAVRLINILFGVKYSDVLGMFRGYKRETIERMGLHKLPTENWLRRWYWYMNSWEVIGSARSARLRLNVGHIPGMEPLRVGGVRKISIIKHGLGVLMGIAYEFLFCWKEHPTSGQRES